MVVPGDCCCRIANQVTQTPLTISHREVPGPRVHHSWGTAAPLWPKAARGDSQNSTYWERAVPLPMDHWVPSCTGLQEWYLRMKSLSKKAGGRRKGQDAGCSHCRTCLQLCLKLVLCLDFLLGAPVICKQYHRDKYRGPWGWGGTRRGGRWGKGRTEGQRLRREKGCKLRDTDSPVIWLTYWVYI